MITSKNNELVKELASLKEKKYRDEKGMYLVEGYKMVREALLAKKKVVRLIGTEVAIEESGIEKLLEKLSADKSDLKVEIVVVSEDVLSRISDCKTPQGLICVLKKEEYSAEPPVGSCILLDGVSDPGNMGTIIRTAAAVGVKGIYLVNCCDPFSPKVVRSSMSGIYSVRLHFIGYDDYGKVFKDVELIAADMGGENIFGYKPSGNFCIAVGNEANGLSEKTIKAANKIASIPMTKNAESLNVGVALSVMLYELTLGSGGKLAE